MSILTASEVRPRATRSRGYLKSHLCNLLQQGLAPQQLALALALGATIGLLPTVWGTSLLCLLIATPLKLNQLALQTANYLVCPLQILLFLPYLKLGEKLFSSKLLLPNLALLSQQFQAAPLASLQLYWQAILQASGAWLISSPLPLISTYFLARLLIKRLQK